jgi:hypothetical protein
MALVVVSSAVNVTIGSVVTAVSSVIRGATEASDHSIRDRVVTARLDVREARVPLEAFATIRDDIRRIRDIKHTLGPMRWVCRIGAAVATLEIDLVSATDDAEPEAPHSSERRALKRVRSDDSASDEDQRSGAKAGALVAIGDSPLRIRRWFADTIAAMDTMLQDVDPALARSLDACRIPRIRMRCIQDTVHCFQQCVSDACRIQERFTTAFEPIEKDVHSPCTCLEVALSGKLTVAVAHLAEATARIEKAAGPFYAPRIILTPDSVRLRLEASNPACPTHTRVL